MCRKICASVLLLLLVASVATSVAEAASELPLEPRVLNQVQSATRSFINVVIRDDRPHTLQAVAHMMGSEAAAHCADTS